MNKITSISLAGMVFNIEETAFQKLDAYLQAVKVHFSSDPDKDEIIADIENRIAEQFLENGNPNKLVTLKHVEHLITVMGNIEDFESSQAENHTEKRKNGQAPSGLSANEKSNARKKLMRDPEDQIVAGVASGLAAYFGMEIWMVRLIFIISLFIGGGGILAYIVLWIIMPEAVSATDKLEMRGSPIDLSSLTRHYKIKKDKNKIQQAERKTSLRKFWHVLARIIRVAIIIILKLIGVLLSIASVAGMIAATFIGLNLLFNIHSPNFEFPLAQVLTPALYYSVVLLAYGIVIVPFIFLLLISLGISRRKNIISGKTGLGLSIFWIIAVMAGGVFAIGFGPQYWDSMQNLPQFQIISETKALSNFTKLNLRGPYTVHVSQGINYSVTVSGISADIEEAQLTVNDNTLFVTPSVFHKVCFFCVTPSYPTINIVMPMLDTLNAQGRLSIAIDSMKLNTFDISLDGLAHLNANVQIAYQANIDMQGSSQANIKGNANTLTLTANSNSYFFGKDFSSKTATVDAIDYARININAINTLTINGDQESTVIYQGNPILQKNLYHNSIVKPASQAIPEENQFNPSYYSSWSREPF